MVALVLCSAIANILVGLLTNCPFALGPGAGTTALFAFSIVLGMGMNWRLAFTAALVESILATALSISLMSALMQNSNIPASVERGNREQIGIAEPVGLVEID